MCGLDLDLVLILDGQQVGILGEHRVDLLRHELIHLRHTTQHTHAIVRTRVSSYQYKIKYTISFYCHFLEARGPECWSRRCDAHLLGCSADEEVGVHQRVQVGVNLMTHIHTWPPRQNHYIKEEER